MRTKSDQYLSGCGTSTVQTVKDRATMLTSPGSQDSVQVAATTFKTFVQMHPEEHMSMDDWEAVDLVSPLTAIP